MYMDRNVQLNPRRWCGNFLYWPVFVKEAEVQVIEKSKRHGQASTEWRNSFPGKNDSEYEARIAAQNLKSLIS
jgi:hypothetical protein